MASKAPKKANLLDHHSIKHILDESVSEVVTSRGYVEDVRLSNVRLVIGAIIIVIALFAQFYKKKFPENRDFLIACIALYPFATILFYLIIYTKEKNAILFTYPPAGSFTSTGLVVSSKLPRFSEMYTLTIASADPKSISANETVQFTKSVTEWHPFSLTSGPQDDYLSVHIRTLGDWSYQIYDLFQEAVLSRSQGCPKLYIDGPYGCAAQDHVKYDILVLIGLGIGATPFISILKDVVIGVQTTEIDHSVVEMHNFLTSVHPEGDIRSALLSVIQALHLAKNGTDIVSRTPVSALLHSNKI
ncbi:hypothetical protein LR48_Vigan11g117800 [Vigna angularis]|uniref:Signal peptidase complex subunit 2 n=1 Tax=Phaseolus angularis TaxID=3914 RepID=A0A0L9VTP8_PHAAN|nr:hypothetical protein LR48_Vigan11g117800 [Vigna angularis]